MAAVTRRTGMRAYEQMKIQSVLDPSVAEVKNTYELFISLNY